MFFEILKFRNYLSEFLPAKSIICLTEKFEIFENFSHFWNLFFNPDRSEIKNLQMRNNLKQMKILFKRWFHARRQNGNRDFEVRELRLL